jgi:hypothetical protein
MAVQPNWPDFRVGWPPPLRFGVDNGPDCCALAIYLGKFVHHARIPKHATPAEIAKCLRELADSIEVG